MPNLKWGHKKDVMMLRHKSGIYWMCGQAYNYGTDRSNEGEKGGRTRRRNYDNKSNGNSSYQSVH